MSATRYDIGDVVRISTTVQSSTGAYTNATMRLVIRTPSTDLVKLTSQLTSTGTGRYRYDFVPSVAGRHAYQFWSTGVVIGSDGGAFGVVGKVASTV